MPRPEKRVKEVVQSGRIVDFKNQLMLIRAFDRVHKKHPDYVLKIYGGDSGDGTREQLEELIAERNAGEYVFLMGASDSLEKVLVNASVFAFSSDWEGLPNALLEAMALGLPIVCLLYTSRPGRIILMTLITLSMVSPVTKGMGAASP